MPLLFHAPFSAFADNFHFYIADSSVPAVATTAWTDESISQGALMLNGAVLIRTARTTPVPVELNVCDSPQENDLRGVDHAVSCSIHLPTGSLQAPRSSGKKGFSVQLSPGHYEVQAMFSGLASVNARGIDGGDRYLVYLWPGEPHAPRVLKQWTGTWRR
jgi:hypothetical protein